MEARRPTTSGGAVVQFTTGEEREYPRGFCKQYAECALEILSSHAGKFVEIFSGPNAPLTKEVCNIMGEPMKGSRLNTDRGVRSELRRLSQVIGEEVHLHASSKASATTASKMPPESTFNRLAMLEAGRQPSYGKRDQLIPDGLNSMEDHLEAALQLSHPFNTEEGLKQDHKRALFTISRSDDEMNKRRLRVLADWRVLSRSDDVRLLQAEHELEACESARRLGRKPRTALLKLLGDRYGVEDKAAPELLLTGMPIVGPALESPFFKEYRVPASITVYELLASAEKRRPQTVRRVEFMAKKGGKKMAEAIYRKTEKEVQKGSMGGPFSHEDLVTKHGRHYNLIPAFGLEQGVDEQGQPKYRRIDDHTAGYTNLAGERRQKIEMAMTDYLVGLVKAMYSIFKSPVVFGSEDMQGAYRQIPLPDKQVSLAVTAVYNPRKEATEFFELYGQPFGAAHAVPNFYRVSEFMSVLMIRGYDMLIDHFFDDFFYIDRPGCSKVSMFCLQQTFQLVGLTLDPDKSQVPSEVAHILGVAFNSTAIYNERLLHVEPKPSRKTNFQRMIHHILETGCLPPSVAASVVGKFGFLCSTLFGKVGRFCTGYIRERQYSAGPDHSLTPAIILSLQLMDHVVQTAPHRSCSLGSFPPPFILYTDASDVPNRDPRYGVGGVLIQQHPAFRMSYFSAAVPISLVQTWIPKQTQMGQLEVLAAPCALHTWGSQLKGQQVIHFIDNNAAASCLVKGYNPKTDSTPLIGDYWTTAAHHGIDIYIDRVESKSNLSDGPSRFILTDMESFHALPVPVVFPPRQVSPLFIFGQ